MMFERVSASVRRPACPVRAEGAFVAVVAESRRIAAARHRPRAQAGCPRQAPGMTRERRT